MNQYRHEELFALAVLLGLGILLLVCAAGMFNEATQSIEYISTAVVFVIAVCLLTPPMVVAYERFKE